MKECITLKSQIEAYVWSQTYAAAIGARQSVEVASGHADESVRQIRKRYEIVNNDKDDFGGFIVVENETDPYDIKLEDRK